MTSEFKNMGDWLLNLPSCAITLNTPKKIISKDSSTFKLTELDLSFIYNNDNYYKLAKDENDTSYGIIFYPDNNYINPNYFQIEIQAEIQNNTNKEISFFLSPTSYINAFYAPVNLLPSKIAQVNRINFINCLQPSKLNPIIPNQIVRFNINELMQMSFTNNLIDNINLDITILSLYCRINLIYDNIDINNNENIELQWYSELPIIGDSISSKRPEINKLKNIVNSPRIIIDEVSNYILTYNDYSDSTKLPLYNSLFVNSLGINNMVSINEGDVVKNPFIHIDNSNYTDFTIYRKSSSFKKYQDAISTHWHNNNEQPNLGFDLVVHL